MNWALITSTGRLIWPLSHTHTPFCSGGVCWGTHTLWISGPSLTRSQPQNEAILCSTHILFQTNLLMADVGAMRVVIGLLKCWDRRFVTSASVFQVSQQNIDQSSSLWALLILWQISWHKFCRDHNSPVCSFWSSSRVGDDWWQINQNFLN